MELVTHTKIQSQCRKGGDSQTSGIRLRTRLSKNWRSCCCSIMNEMMKGAHWRLSLTRQILHRLPVDSRNDRPTLSYTAYNLKTIGQHMLAPGFLNQQPFNKCLLALATTSPALRLNWTILLVLVTVLKLSVWTRGDQPCSWRITFLQTSVPNLL